jgi:type IV pilus assembly protein PilM
VDISDNSLKYVYFTPDPLHHGTLRLKAWGDIDIPSDTLARGNVKNPTSLQKVLEEVKQKIPTPYVRVSLPEERAYLFETEIKRDTPFKEIRGQLEFRLEENVPLSPRDAFFDYDIITAPDQSGPLRVSVTVYARDTILGYYDAVRAAGLIPLSFEVEAQAIARAALPRGDQGTHLIVDFGKTRTGVGIVYRGSLMYTSTIDIGGKELSSALRRQLGDRPESELTEIKNTQGLVRQMQDTSAYDALITTMSAIKDEIAMRMHYWDTHAADLPDSRIVSMVLCGGSCNLKGLPGYFSETLGLPTKRALVWQNAFSLEQFVPPIGRRYSYGYATAIGLALTSFVDL